MFRGWACASELVLDGASCQQDAEREGWMREEWELHPDTEGAEGHVELTYFPTKDDQRSQRRKGEEVTLSQRRIRLPSLEEGHKVPDATESRGLSRQLTWLVIKLFFFPQGGDKERERENQWRWTNWLEGRVKPNEYWESGIASAKININNEVGIRVGKKKRLKKHQGGCSWQGCSCSEPWRQGIGMVMFDLHTLERGSVRIMCLSS